MEWTKQRKLPPCKAIQYNGQPCHAMGDLFDALHNTYNLANDRPVDLSALNPLPQMAEREWVTFSELELKEALSACASVSAPGPNHIKWPYLKAITKELDALQVLVSLANGCLTSGHWCYERLHGLIDTSFVSLAYLIPFLSYHLSYCHLIIVALPLTLLLFVFVLCCALQSFP